MNIYVVSAKSIEYRVSVDPQAGISVRVTQKKQYLNSTALSMTKYQTVCIKFSFGQVIDTQ